MGCLRRTLLAGAATTLGLGALNVRLERGAGAIYNAVGGESKYYLWKNGDVFYALKGEGQPLVLIHGINAAASSFEMRKNFGPLAESFRVYAPDLLGFGLSDRPPLVYTAETYVELIGDFLREVVREPADIVASSLSGAFTIEATRRNPDLVRRLVLIAPTGIGHLDRPPGPAEDAFFQLVRSPIYGTALFNVIASRPSIAGFNKSMVYRDQALVTDDLVEYQYNSAHQAGAKWAPASFVSGHLNIDVRQSWAALKQPTVLAWGRYAKITPLEQANAFLRLNPEAKLSIFESSGLLPHDEEAEAFNQMVKTTFS
jgi:pimeloyl-ACP methyl ester carboxylesterase